MVHLQENVSLAQYANYRIGGPARYFATPTTIEELKDAIRSAHLHTKNIFILGGGTNLLIPDSGFLGAVIKPELHTLEVHGDVIHVGAGVLMAELVEYAANEGLSGLEWAGGLPGTVGGAVRGNAGAFGGETKDNTKEVRSLNIETLEEHVWDHDACEFGYRNSMFKMKHGKEVITSAVFALSEGEPEKIRADAQKNIDYRAERHPLEYPNIGSIFKNVPTAFMPTDKIIEVSHVVKNDPFPVVPVAYLIAQCNLKGTRHGGAMVSDKHPNFIVNVDHAKSSDVEYLITVVKDAVYKKYGVRIEEEVMKL